MTGEPEGLRANESEEPLQDETPATEESPATEPTKASDATTEAPPAPALPPDLPNPSPSGEKSASPEPTSPYELRVEHAAVSTAPEIPQAADAEETSSAPSVPAAPPAEIPAEPDHDAVPGIPSTDGADADDDDPAELYEEMLESFAPETSEFRVGDRKVGHIVTVSDDGVVVDVGAKTEGFISLRDTPTGEERPDLKVGDEIPVIITRLGEPGEYVLLSPARDENREALEALEKAHQEKQPVTAKVLERVKGGLTVDVGVPAFLPGSQLALRGGQNLDSFLGQEFPVQIVKMSRRRGNVVVSRRAVLEEEAGKLKQETLSKRTLGGEATGVVKNVTSYGAFVDLGGVDGLIHVTDISHGRLKDPSEALKPGEEITAKVIKLDPEKERVSLSLKEMEPDPWAGVDESFNTGDKVAGTVASITDYGAFVELQSGVEGLVHISELTWSKRLQHPSKVLKAGQEVEAVVLKVQPSARRISLSLKNLHPDPWESLGTEFEVGAIVEGRVRNVTTYGAFVEIREGIDGLVHVSDLSWDSSVRNPKDVLKKGETIKAVVLGVDRENRRMSFGVKQLQPDVWETFFSQYVVGDVLPGLMTRQAKFGVFAQLSEGVEGLCHNSEMPPRSQRKGKQRLERGKRYEFEIIRLDEFDRRVGLRCKSYDILVDPNEAVAEPPPPPPPEARPEEVAEQEPATTEEATDTADSPEADAVDPAAVADAETDSTPSEENQSVAPVEEDKPGSESVESSGS